MRDYYLGFDPGKRGFMCVYDGTYGGFRHYPLYEGNRLNRDMIEELWRMSGVGSVMAVVEQVHSMPHQGLASTFSFGTNYGMIIGALLQGERAYGGVLQQMIARKIDVRRVKKPLFDIDYSDFFHIRENTYEFYYD